MKKRYLVILLFMIWTVKVFCQQITFQKIYRTYPLAGLEYHYEVIQTPDKGFLTGNYQMLLNIDSIGKKKWMNFVDSTIFLAFDNVHDGGYITVGSFHVLKLNSNYSISWVKKFTNIPSVLYYTVQETYDYGFILGGYGNSEYHLVKLDSVGTVQWSKTYSAPQQLDFEFLTRSPDKGFLLSGNVLNGTHPEILIIKVDSLGNLLWSKKVVSQSSSTSYFNHIVPTSDGNYVLSGYRNLHRYLLKIDLSGNLLWMKKYDAGIAGNATWVEETHDHGLIVTGSFSINTSGQTSLLMKTDSTGTLKWARALGGYSDIWTGCVKQTEDRGFIIGARVVGGPGGGERFFLIKTDSLGHTNGCLEDTVTVIVSNLNDSVVNFPVSENIVNVTTVLTSLTLTDTGSVITLCAPLDIIEIEKNKEEIEIYPNPFSEQLTVINDKLTGKVSIKIYDLMGEKVFQTELLPYQTNAELYLLFLKQGVYFLNVKANGSSYTKKVVKM